MARSRASGRPGSASRTGGRASGNVAPATPPLPWLGRGLDLLLALLAAAIVIAVFHRATGYFFRADDFEGLARARGVLPERSGLARLIPWRLYFDGFEAAFGLNPFPYHVASLTALAASAALVFAWLRGPAGRWGAFAGAAFYAAHPYHFASAYWISALGDPLALAFSLGALLAARSASAVRWAAIPLFALALASKETALLVPVVAFLDPGRAASLPRARRDPLPWVLVALSAAMVAHYLTADPLGTRHAAGQAYVPRLGGHVGLNLLTYAGWTVNFVVATVATIGDVIDPTVFVPGGIFLALLGAGMAWPRLRRGGWLAGGALWLAMLAPVLPLAKHTYYYYLTGPLAGAAFLLAVGLATLARSLPRALTAQGGPAAALGALTLAAFFVANGVDFVRRMEFMPFRLPGSRADSIVDRALIAAKVAESLRGATLPAGATLRFWSPESRQISGLADTAATFGYWERNVQASILDSVGVRVLVPTIGRVEFVPRFSLDRDSLWYAIYAPDGRLTIARAEEIAGSLPVAPDR